MCVLLENGMDGGGDAAGFRVVDAVTMGESLNIAKVHVQIRGNN
jgi:hypothetical protein